MKRTEVINVCDACDREEPEVKVTPHVLVVDTIHPHVVDTCDDCWASKDVRTLLVAGRESRQAIKSARRHPLVLTIEEVQWKSERASRRNP